MSAPPQAPSPGLDAARRRPAARFPLLRPPREDRSAAPPADPASSASRLPRVGWAGGPPPLRSLIADHVAAAGARLEDVAPEEVAAQPPSLLLGTVDALALLAPPGRSGAPAGQRPGPAPLLAVAEDGPLAEEDWHRCLQLGVRAMLRLPADSGPLLDLLGRALRDRGGALVIGVVGGCAGAAASSTAAALAGAMARRGAPTVLVDADPAGGGLDVLVEAPPSRGGAWADVGRLEAQDGARLRAGLPQVDGVHLLAARTGP
ncbi:hypothetical protein ACFFF6_08140, partial [Brachybacterium hainanense]